MFNKNHHISYKSILQRTLAFLFVSLLVYSCVRDDFYQEQNTSNQDVNDYKFNKISFSDLKNNNTKALKKIEQISSLKNKTKGRAYRTIYNEQYGVFIDTTQIVMLSKDNEHTITFRIVSDNENENEVENLVLKSRENGEYSAYITKYELSDNDLLNPSLKSVTSVDNNYQTNSLGLDSSCVDTRTVTLTLCWDDDGNVVEHYGDVDGTCNGMGFTQTYLVIYIDLKCLRGGAGGGAYTGGGVVPGAGIIGGDFGIGGGSGGGSGSSNNPGSGNAPAPGNGNINPENPNDGLFYGYDIFPFPNLPTTPILPNPEPGPIDHIVELNKITDKDAETPFRAKIDEYVGMLDAAEVEVGIVYVKNENGSYDEIYPTATYFDHIDFSNVLIPVNRAELGIHLHHNQSNSEGDKLTHAPSTGDVIGFCDTFFLTYSNSTSNKERWTDIVVTANGLYALRGIEPQKVITFAKAFSNPTMLEKIMNIFNQKYNEKVLEYASDELDNSCNNGCTTEQIKQTYNSAVDQGFVNFINYMNKNYKIGVGVFKGTLNTNTGNYDWQQVSE